VKDSRFITGPAKAWTYVRIAAGVALRYARRMGELRWSPKDYILFLSRALRLLLVFRHNKAVRTRSGIKLHLYLPAYPSPAFFHALDAKLVRRPPGPTTVVFSMTKACRYRCEHCYQRTDRGADMDAELMAASAVAMRDAGVAMFDIEGGEPLLRFDRLIALMRALDERSEIWVNTTGDGLEENMLRELEDAGLYGVMISVHSTSREKHDRMTGVAGSFGSAVRALRMFKKHGFVTAVNSVLSEQEVRDGRLTDLMDFAGDQGCDFVQLIHPKPAGRWLGRREEMQTDPAVLRHLRAQHLRYNSRAFQGHPSLAAQVFEESPDVLGCTAGGVDRFYMNAHGEVQPCEFLNVSFGNVAEEPFETILARMRDAFREPCCDWLCCTQGAAIAAIARRNSLSDMPLRWPQTQELIAGWDRGGRTPVYDKLGIYR